MSANGRLGLTQGTTSTASPFSGNSITKLSVEYCRTSSFIFLFAKLKRKLCLCQGYSGPFMITGGQVIKHSSPGVLKKGRRCLDNLVLLVNLVMTRGPPV